jgi:hypothetical protein
MCGPAILQSGWPLFFSLEYADREKANEARPVTDGCSFDQFLHSAFGSSHGINRAVATMGGIGAGYPSRPRKFQAFALGVRGHKDWGVPTGSPQVELEQIGCQATV